jgi:hypothetical protein
MLTAQVVPYSCCESGMAGAGQAQGVTPTAATAGSDHCQPATDNWFS